MFTLIREHTEWLDPARPRREHVSVLVIQSLAFFKNSSQWVIRD